MVDWCQQQVDPFWPCHFDFGTHRPWLIGSARGDEVAVNVLLPGRRAF